MRGPLDENQYVFDFIALRDNLQSIVNRLDHRMLLPTRHPRIRVETEGAEVTARYGDRRWVFPADECVLMPLVEAGLALGLVVLLYRRKHSLDSESWSVMRG